MVHVKGGSSGHPRRWRLNYAFHRGMWLFYRTHYAPTPPVPGHVARVGRRVVEAGRLGVQERSQPRSHPRSSPVGAATS